jgi:hypothetical protein
VAISGALNVRSRLLERLAEDLVGPKGGAEEVIDERPSARYLTGILYPQQTEFLEEEDEQIEAENGAGSEADDGEEQATSLFRSFKPAACGFSFSVEGDEGADLRLTVQYGRYTAEEIEAEEGGRKYLRWTRTPHELADVCISLAEGISDQELDTGLKLHRRVRRDGAVATVTLQFVNQFREATGQSDGADNPLIVADMIGRETAGFYQFEASVRCKSGCRFVPRRRAFRGNDEDERIADLIYRDFAEYAVGHTASAVWNPTSDRQTGQRVSCRGLELASWPIKAARAASYEFGVVSEPTHKPIEKCPSPNGQSPERRSCSHDVANAAAR